MKRGITWAWIASHTQRKAFNNNNDVVYTEFSVLRGIQVTNLQEVKVEAGEADQVGTGETLLADEERRGCGYAGGIFQLQADLPTLSSVEGSSALLSLPRS